MMFLDCDFLFYVYKRVQSLLEKHMCHINKNIIIKNTKKIFQLKQEQKFTIFAGCLRTKLVIIPEVELFLYNYYNQTMY